MINRWYKNIISGEKAKLINIKDAEPYGFSMFRVVYVLEYTDGKIVELNIVTFRAVWDMI